MSSVKSQLKWVAKYFSGLVLAVFVAIAAVAYFTTRISSSNFNAIALVVIALVLALVYYGFVNLRSGLVFALLAILLVIGVKFSSHPNIKSGQFQAVTLTNGATFYGHLKNVDSDTATLTEVYTLQTTQQPSSTDSKTTTTTPVLVNLSRVLPDPENEMTIKTDKIVLWENLQDSGKVVQAIRKDLAKK
jgi:hypothetical protein